jgi:GH25 family lysozyme M1 (1,4-beta-N-acetylmuramidase)
LNYLVLRVAYGKVNSQQFGIRVAVLPSINIAGPGGRIGGVDISRWQHSVLPINFKQMAKSGIAFVFIKGSDGNPDDDVISRPLANADSASVKAAGMYVGYYHFGRVPASNSSPVLIQSAQKQAKQALARLAELGGYGGYTLPYVLDIESAPSMSTSASITLWTKTWLDAMYSATGRRSIVYSYRYFLSRKFSNDSASRDYLRQSPLWLAHPGNPANPDVIPGRIDNSPGCFQTAWTLPDCSATWSFWQYTSSGDRELYGIPWSPARGTSCPTNVKYCSLFVGQARRHLDMNVFNGSISDLMALAQGTWTQTPKPVINPSPSPTPNPTPTPLATSTPTPSAAP